MADAQNRAVVKPKTRKMQMHENANARPRAQNPRPNAGTQYHGPNPDSTPNQGTGPHNASDEIAALRKQLQESQDQVKDLRQKWMASIAKGAQCQFRLDQLHRYYDYCKTSAKETINGLKKQLEEARGNKPKNHSDTVSVTEKLADVTTNMQDQRSSPAAELCGEPCTQATEVSHTDLKPAKVAEVEVQSNRHQEQIQQLQQQLLKAQRELEEQANQHRLEKEQLHSEIKELKSQICPNKDLHASNLKHMKEQREEKTSIANQLQKAEMAKTSVSLQESLQKKQCTEQGEKGKVDSLLQTSVSLQESAQEKQDSGQGKEEKGDSLLKTVTSLQESLQTKQGEENILIAELDKPEAQTTIVPEKKSKKKKRHWLLRLFT